MCYNDDMMKGIHPEFLLERKGGRFESLINFLALIGFGDNPELDLPEDQKSRNWLVTETELFDQANRTLIAGSISWAEHKISIFKRIRENRNLAVYRASDSFFEDVKQLKREIPHTYITDDDNPVFISFKPHKVGPFTFNGVYVQMFTKEAGGAACLNLLFTEATHYSIMMSRSMMVVDPSGKFDLAGSLRETPEFMQSRTLIQSDMRFSNPADARAFNDLVAAAVNTAVYVNSRDPEIEELKPLRMYSKQALSSLGQARRENLCTLPVKLVNWSYYRHFNVDSTSVSAHLRWQPCGPGRRDVKLVWVKEHTRNYRQEESESVGRPTV